MQLPYFYCVSNTKKCSEAFKLADFQHPILREASLHNINEYLPKYHIGAIIVEMNHNIDEITHFLATDPLTIQIPVIGISRYSEQKMIKPYHQTGLQHIIHINELSALEERFAPQLYSQKLLSSLQDLQINSEYITALMHRALLTIETYYLWILSVKELANNLNTHPSNLNKQFSKHIGYSPYQLINRIKLKHSLHLMQYPDLSLKTIAYLSGFTNYCQFGECLYKAFFVSPSVLKQKVNLYEVESEWKTRKSPP